MNNFYEKLPKKRMGAGCLFFDETGNLLLLKPSYKDGWEIPGGIVESNESPKHCCIREVEEELALKKPIGRLLVVDYNTYPDRPSVPESLMFIFDGGVLTSQDISAIQLSSEEITRFSFYSPDSLPDDLTRSLSRRITMAVKARNSATDVYLEDQSLT